MGHHVIARSLEVSEVAAATAEAMPDVALVGLGESSEHALDLISQIVQEAACPVIAILETKDADVRQRSGQAGDLRLRDRRRSGGAAGRGRHRPAALRRVPPPGGRAWPPRAHRAGQGDPDGALRDRRAGGLRAAPLPLPANGPQADRRGRGRHHQPPPARDGARAGVQQLAPLRREAEGVPSAQPDLEDRPLHHLLQRHAASPGPGRAVVDVLERLGHEVDFPEEQTCCGQMHANSGYRLEAVPLVRRFVDVFGDAESSCRPSASCVAMVARPVPAAARSSPATPAWLAREVRAIAPRVFELTEFLVDRLGIEDVGAVLPPPRHLPPDLPLGSGCCGVGDRPLRLLRAVRGLDLVELPERARSAAGSAARSRSRTPTRRSAMLRDKLRADPRPGPRSAWRRTTPA